MAYLQLTGQISHRHPFHGMGEYIKPDMYDFDISSVDRLYSGVQGFGADQTTQQKVIGALAMAAIGGIGAYFIAKSLGKSGKKATTWGTFGALGLGIASILGERKQA